jgi:hypothetical protein
LCEKLVDVFTSFLFEHVFEPFARHLRPEGRKRKARRRLSGAPSAAPMAREDKRSGLSNFVR